MKIAIIGAGAIGLCTAYELISQHSDDVEITIFDKFRSPKLSATEAAGAMEAIFGEVEHGFRNSSFQKSLVHNGLVVRSRWTEMFNTLGQDLCTADSTIVFLNTNANDFERRNFEEMLSVAQEFNELEYVKPEHVFANGGIKHKEVVARLKNERGFDARGFVRRLKKYLYDREVIFVEENVESIDTNACNVILKNASSEVNCAFDKIIVAAGANSAEILSEIEDIIPLFRGMGTALLVENVQFNDAISERTVYRSVNRGGSQCGLHFVPGVSALEGYVGAGNSLSIFPDEHIRFETVRYLMNELESDLVGQTGLYRSKGAILLGDRCRSMDYYPTLGMIKENHNIILASGFNRIGLTYAPLIAADVAEFVSSKNAKYFVDYAPQRALVPFGTVEESAVEFSEITCANLIEHEMIAQNQILQKKEELKRVGFNLNNSINRKFNLPADHGHFADALSVIEQLK